MGHRHTQVQIPVLTLPTHVVRDTAPGSQPSSWFVEEYLLQKVVGQSKCVTVLTAHGGHLPPSFQGDFCGGDLETSLLTQALPGGLLPSLHGASITGLRLRASVYEINELCLRNHRTFLIFDLLQAFTGLSEPRNFSCPYLAPSPPISMNSIVLASFAPGPGKGLCLQKGPEVLAFHPGPGRQPTRASRGRAGTQAAHHTAVGGRQTSASRLGLGPSSLCLFPCGSQNGLYPKDGETAKESVGS